VIGLGIRPASLCAPKPNDRLGQKHAVDIGWCRLCFSPTKGHQFVVVLHGAWISKNPLNTREHRQLSVFVFEVFMHRQTLYADRICAIAGSVAGDRLASKT